jgi:hypothetical protein
MVTKGEEWVQVKNSVISIFYTILLHLTAFDSLDGAGSAHGGQEEKVVEFPYSAFVVFVIFVVR